MGTKEWIYQPYRGAALYQELSLDDKNNNPATIEIESPQNFCVKREEYTPGTVSFLLRVEIDAEQFDTIAVEWCKKRKLHGALGGPVGLEFGSPDADDDSDLIEIAKSRLDQEEVPADLEFKNIFDAIAKGKDEAISLKLESDKLIKLRETLEQINRLFPFAKDINSKDDHANALSLMEHLIEDYDHNVILIEALSCSIKRYEDS